MTKPARDANQRWLGFLLPALVAVLVTLFGAGTASAATASAAQTRVGAHTLVAQVVVGPHGGIGAGQRLGNDPPAYDFVLATGVAANTVDSSAVRFSQSSVKGAFSDGRSIDGLADRLRSGAVNPGDVPAMRLVERDGSLFSLDNRRLLAFQKAGMDVPYRMATPSEAASEAWKFSTTNGGTSIRIRGGGGVWP